VDSEGRTIWIVDAHRDNGRRSIARAEEKLMAFLELESLISGSFLTSCNATGGAPLHHTAIGSVK
jgi:hypothetical protein